MRLLVCDISGEIQGVDIGSDTLLVKSAVQCLDHAVVDRPDAVVIRFGDITLRERGALIELCGILKQNPYTKGICVTALLCLKNRFVVERLRNTGVNYIRFLAIGKPYQVEIDAASVKPESKKQLDFLLELLCAYLHYCKIDSRHEMPVCGAYLDRKVLGGQRLHEICETGKHRLCKYYLNPRDRL